MRAPQLGGGAQEGLPLFHTEIQLIFSPLILPATLIQCAPQDLKDLTEYVYHTILHGFNHKVSRELAAFFVYFLILGLKVRRGKPRSDL